MPTAIIIHGLEGNPTKNWYSWLKGELEKKGWYAIVPQFPHPDRPLLKEWEETFHALPESRAEEVILVGHSLGVPFIMAILEKKKARTAYLVGGFVGDLGASDDEVRSTFCRRTFDWKKIRSHCTHFVVLNSDDDPYVPLAKGEGLAAHLGVKVTLVKGAGHFNKSAGYTTFPLLLKTMLKEN